jgi:hypothetical protein
MMLLVAPGYGLSERMELSLEMPLRIHSPAGGRSLSGLGDIIIGMKMLLLDPGEDSPAIAVKGSVKTPSGNQDVGFGSGGLDWSLSTVLSRELGPVTVHAVAGYAHIGGHGERGPLSVALFGAAADVSVSDVLHLALECTGDAPLARGVGASPAVALVGGALDVSESVTIDVSLRAPLSAATPWACTSLGFSLTL